MKKRLKIALFMIAPLSFGGGTEKYFINLTKNLSEKNIKVDIITMDNSFNKVFIRLINIYYLKDLFKKTTKTGREDKGTIEKNLGKGKWIRSSWKNLKKILNNYDIIYTKNELVDLFLLKCLNFNKLPPIIVGVHTPIFYPVTKSFYSKFHNFLYMGPVYRFLIKGTKLIHAPNKYTQYLFLNYFKVKTKLVYHPFSVNDSTNQIKKDESKLCFNKNIYNIAFVSRLSEQKGVDILLKIIERLSTVPNLTNKISINIFGSGDKNYEEILRNYENKYSFIRYYGHVENKYIPNILSKHSLFLSTSRWEVLPYNILEAQAVGLPVIAFDISGPNDIVINNKTGFLVSNEEGFINKILFIIQNKGYFKIQDIKTNISSKFDSKEIYNQLFSMFSESI